MGPPSLPGSCADLRTAAICRLLSAWRAGGRFEGELASSALSTATASFALELFRRTAEPAIRPRLAAAVRGGLQWLATHQNADGGFGDTPGSPSNSSTTVLGWVALGAGAAGDAACEAAAERAADWLSGWVQGLSPETLSRHILASYGDDRTFSVPILTMCALGGRFGHGPAAWRAIPTIPFEVAAVPRRWFPRLGLPMVSYALPALIAMGQVRHHHCPSRNPLARLVRAAVRRRTLRILGEIQPRDGGFLEAAPLTSFVAMSLIGSGAATHPVVSRAVDFLLTTVRDDGSWPIDTSLTTWLTTLSVTALAGGGELARHLDAGRRRQLRDGLLARQYRDEHPYTLASPGGWAWTDASGGVPDADDTAGALVALRHLSDAADDTDGAAVDRAAAQGVRWLIDLQNRDGGIPTFCRGWGKLPFDRSSPDLTAHALRAWDGWRDRLPPALAVRVRRAMERAVDHLIDTQTDGGEWVPLWFGNQHTPGQTSPLYGTARVLCASAVDPTDRRRRVRWAAALLRGLRWLVAAQGADGGWGGAPGGTPSVEETALAVEALAGFDERQAPGVEAAIERGLIWLRAATAGGTQFPAAPIGLYFARLWYHERLYPVIFTVAALVKLAGRQRLSRCRSPSSESAG